MKNLVRGGIILSLVGTLFVFVIAQTQTEKVPVIANDSRLEANIYQSNLENNKKLVNKQDSSETAKKEEVKEDQEVKGQQDKQDKKLVEKTVSSKAVMANRGSFVATAYCLRGRTATGTNVRKGIIAADTRVLRLRSKVVLGAGAHSGEYVVADTGGKIKGKRIDIWMASCADARRFGRRTVTVHVP